MAEKKKLSAEERNRTLVRLLPVASGALLLAAVSIVSAHFIPVLVGDAIDLALGKGQVDMPGILKILSVIPLLAVLSALFDWLVRIAGTRLSAAVTRDIRADCIRKIERLPLSYLDSHRTGDTLSRIASRNGVSVRQLCKLNGLTTKSKLKPGKKLRLH